MKKADIIIPHHNRHDLLKECLKYLDLEKYNIIIVCGNTFAINCNKGAEIAKTNNIIFLNDDTEPTPQFIDGVSELIETNYIVGVKQYLIDKKECFVGVNVKLDREKGVLGERTSNIKNETIPSGVCFGIKRKDWLVLGGFDINFRNGGEDTDLFLRAKYEKNMKFKFYTEYPLLHKHSQSEGRHRYSQQNIIYLNKKHKKLYENLSN